MKIGVIGTGAVGGYFGAKLVKAGFDVLFVGTAHSASIIKQKGLTVISKKGDIRIDNPDVTSDYGRLKEVSIILLCTKAYTTESIAQKLKEIIDDKTLVISLQNGIENEEILAEKLSLNQVIGGSIYLSASSMMPGEVLHGGSGAILIGELNGAHSERLEEIKEIFEKATIPIKTTTNIKKYLWKKLIINSAYNGLSAIIGKSLHGIAEIEEAEQMYYDILKEGQAIALYDGFEFTDEEIHECLEMLKNNVFLDFKTSTLQDREKSRPLEIDSIQGAIIRTAKKYGISAPLNNMMYGLLKLIEQ